MINQNEAGTGWTVPPGTSGAASSGSNANLNSSSNANLPGYYNSANNSVISGPPLLGGANMGVNRPATLTSYSYNAPQAENASSVPPNVSAGDPVQRTVPAPDALQRSHSNSFNGYLYSHQPITGSQQTGNSSMVPTLMQPGSIATNHIDFMNINNSPPLLSGSSQGLFLSNLGNKTGDNIGMMNHTTMFTGMHSILPVSSGSYNNLAGFNTGPLDALTANGPGTKRATPLTANAAGNPTAKKAKASSARSRAASYAAPLEGSNPAMYAPASGAPQMQQYGPPPMQGVVQGNNQAVASAPLGGMQPPSVSAVLPPGTGTENAAFPPRALPEQQRTGMPPPPELFRSQSQGLQGSTPGSAPSMQAAQSQIHQAQLPQPGPSTAAGGAAVVADGADVRTPGNAMPPGQYKPPMQQRQQQQIPQAGYTSGQMMDSTNGGLSSAAVNVQPMSSGSYQFQPGTRPAGMPAAQPPTQYSGQYQQQVQQHQQQYSQGPMQAQQYHPPPQQQPQQLQQPQQQPQQFSGQYGQQHAQQMQSQPHLQQPQQHQTHQYTQPQMQQSMAYAQPQQQQQAAQYAPQHAPQHQHQQHPQAQQYNPAQQQQLNQHQQQGMQYSQAQQRPQLQPQMGLHNQQHQPLHAPQQQFLHQQHQQYQPQYQAQQQAPQQQQQPQWVTSSGMAGLTAPPVVGQVVPQALMAKGAAKLPRVRVKTPKPGKKALAAAAAAGSFIHSGQEYSTVMDTTAGPDGPPGSGGNVKPMTYKEKRAASSKKAIAAAAEAERVRNGDISVRDDGKRKDAKRERDVTVHADADGRPDKDKSEKEESSTALLKRRDPVAARLEEIENAKFLGRKCPPAALPAITPMLPDAEQVKAAVATTSSWANHVIAPIPADRRRKTHWDYVLEEVQWMAVDFRQELRWKLAASKVVADACVTSSSRCKISSVGRISADDAAQARSVAQRLSRNVVDYWAYWAEKVDSQCHECEEESDSKDSSEARENSLAVTAAISKITERILQLPIQLSAECEEPKSSGAADGKTDKTKGAHRTGKSPSRDKVGGAPAEKAAAPEFPYTLQAHQLSAAQKVQALGKLGFGAILGGRSFVGKTVVVCSLMQQWLAASASPAASAVPVIIVVVAPQCLYRWVVQLREVGLAKRSTIWDRGEDHLPASSVVLVVPSDQLSAFMSGRVHADLAAEKGSSAEGSNAEDDTPPESPRAVVGFVADLRCTPAAEIATVLTQLGRAASQIAPLLSARCLLTEDAAPQDTPLSTLWLLSPGTTLQDWQAAYPTSGVDLHADHIKRNTLSQLIANLSVVMKMPASADSMVAAQTRLEILAAEMDVAQTRLYNIVVSQILRHAAIYSGENTAKLARALLILRRVCFHASLLTFKGEKRLDYVHGLRSAAQLNSTGTATMEPYTDSHSYDRSVLAYGIPAIQSAPTSSSYWTPANTTPSGLTPSATLGNPSAAAAFHAGAIRMSATGASYRGGTFAAGLVQGDRGSAEQPEIGSCKLASLRRLVKRFAGLKLAILIDSNDDFRLVSEALQREPVDFLSAFVPRTGSVSTSEGDGMHEWLKSQSAVEAFNSSSTTCGVLICSKHVFQPPSMHPCQADAVVVLSDDWLCCTEVKDCFRLRLLSAGPTGPPLTVVRVVAAGTIEERMARKGQSFLQLQGTPVSQLYPGLQDLQAMSPLPSTTGNLPRASSGADITSSEQQLLLHKAPTLVLIPVAAKGLTPISRDSAQNLQQSEGSNASLAQGTDSTEAGADHPAGGRGQGKGIVLGGRPSAAVSQNSGLARARSSIVSALSGLSSTDPLRQPDAQNWLKALRRDLRAAEKAFEMRNETIAITSERDLTLVLPKDRPRVITASVETPCSNAAGVSVALGRLLLKKTLARLSSCGTAVSPPCTEDMHGSHICALVTAQAVRDTPNEALDATEEQAFGTTDNKFTELERRRLMESGLGRTEPERILNNLTISYRQESVTPAVDLVKPKSDTDGARSWPQAFFVFRDMLYEARRQGIDVDASLFVNPLQTACRYDTVSIQSNASAGGSVNLDISIKYLHDSSKASCGQGRLAKPRRSRPSGASSRRKDPSKAAGAEADADAAEDAVAAAQGNKEMGMNFEMGFLSDLDPMGDSPLKQPKTSAYSSVGNSPELVSANPVVKASTTQEQAYDSWHATEDDIIICTQNAFSDPHFKRTETWLNKALEQARKRRRTATDTRLRYSWLCTTGRTQQRLQDPVIIAQIEQLRSTVASRTAALAVGGSNVGSPASVNPASVTSDDPAVSADLIF